MTLQGMAKLIELWLIDKLIREFPASVRAVR
jgi:hypothetical protein